LEVFEPNSWDQVSLTDCKLNCIIGVLPAERNNKQLLSFNIDLFLDTRASAESCDLYHSSDYSLVKVIVERLLDEGRFQLLETAAEAIAHILLHETFSCQLGFPKFVRISLRKPEIFDDGTIPQVTIVRQEAQLQVDLDLEQIFKCHDLEVKTDEESGFVVSFS